MANEKRPRRRKKLRQEWNPHWSLKLLYMIFSVAGSVLKIAVGAAATVLLIVLICGTVFVGTLGDYLQEDILTEAADWSLDDYDLEQTSFIYYVDNHGDIQLLQQIYTTGEVGISKHEPLIYQLAAKSLGTKPEETLVFEDSLYALKTAKNAGFRTIGVYDADGETDQEGVRETGELYLTSLLDFRQYWMKQ